MPPPVTTLLAALYRNVVWDEANFEAAPAEEGPIDLDARDGPSNPQAAPPTTPMDAEPSNRRRRSVRFALEEREQRTGDLPLDLVIERNRQELERTSRSLQRMARRAERQLALMRAQEAHAAQKRVEAARTAQRQADKAAERAARGSVNRTAVEAAWTPEQQRRIDASRAAYEADHQAWFEARSAVYAALLAEMPPPEQRRREDAVALFMTDPQAFLLARRGEWAQHDREMAVAREERRREEERRERERRARREERAARAAARASEASPPTSNAHTRSGECVPTTPAVSPSAATDGQDDVLSDASRDAQNEEAKPAQDT